MPSPRRAGCSARLDRPEVAHPVGDPEVDHLRHRALVGRDVGGSLCSTRAAVSRWMSAPRGTPPGDARRRRHGRGSAARSGCSRPPRASRPGRRPRWHAGSAGRAASGSGCSGGSGRRRRAARSRPRPGGTSCAGAHRPRAAPAGPRRTCGAASCRCASRGTLATAGCAAAKLLEHRCVGRDSRSSSACPSAG